MIQRTIQIGNTRVDVDKIVAYGPYNDSEENILLVLFDNGVNFYDMGVNFKTKEERDAAIVELDRYFKK